MSHTGDLGYSLGWLAVTIVGTYSSSTSEPGVGAHEPQEQPRTSLVPALLGPLAPDGDRRLTRSPCAGTGMEPLAYTLQRTSWPHFTQWHSQGTGTSFGGERGKGQAGAGVAIRMVLVRCVGPPWKRVPVPCRLSDDHSPKLTLGQSLHE